MLDKTYEDVYSFGLPPPHVKHNSVGTTTGIEVTGLDGISMRHQMDTNLLVSNFENVKEMVMRRELNRKKHKIRFPSQMLFKYPRCINITNDMEINWFYEGE